MEGFSLGCSSGRADDGSKRIVYFPSCAGRECCRRGPWVPHGATVRGLRAGSCLKPQLALCSLLISSKQFGVLNVHGFLESER